MEYVQCYGIAMNMAGYGGGFKTTTTVKISLPLVVTITAWVKSECLPSSREIIEH